MEVHFVIQPIIRNLRLLSNSKSGRGQSFFEAERINKSQRGIMYKTLEVEIPSRKPNWIFADPLPYLWIVPPVQIPLQLRGVVEVTPGEAKGSGCPRLAFVDQVAEAVENPV